MLGKPDMEAIPCARYTRYMAPFARNCKERDGGRWKNVTPGENVAPSAAWRNSSPDAGACVSRGGRSHGYGKGANRE
jgi:hypothetical protein